TRFFDGEMSYFQMEKIYLKKDGGSLWANLTSSTLLDNEGKPLYGIAMVEDIGERKIADQKIRKSLKEKEVLLKEIHHRVKNNLQVICSLLSLQSSYIKSTDNSDIFNESQNRIKSMALVHEFLYQSDNLASINFKEYMNTLVDNLLSSYEADIYNISSVIEVEDITLDIDTAIPCGLIINELVSNSIKHAFPWAKENLGSGDRKNMISIELFMTDNGFYNLNISDNGKGFPSNIDFRDTNSLGLKLVCALTEQLNFVRGSPLCQ
ncbi:MAG: PAS domain S-box protein, partial [Candidatus Dadabacteria bacterium]|nr:PAS domain S-box protein [Candidatus Dadabacteria bacterium]